MELYDSKDSHLKTLTFANYEQYLDQFWRAGEQTMVNHLTGASTVLHWTDFRFRTNLDDSEFNQTGTATRALMRLTGAIAALVLAAGAGIEAWALDLG